MLTIGAVLPAIAIFAATDAKDFLTMTGGLDVVDGRESRLVGRVIQVLYTAVLSLFPAILYFQFDRNRVGTIRSAWVRAIFRMDRRMETLADVNARYGDQLSEASSKSTDSVRFLGGRNSPIVVATLLISTGVDAARRPDRLVRLRRGLEGRHAGRGGRCGGRALQFCRRIGRGGRDRPGRGGRCRGRGAGNRDARR